MQDLQEDVKLTADGTNIGKKIHCSGGCIDIDGQPIGIYYRRVCNGYCTIPTKYSFCTIQLKIV